MRAVARSLPNSYTFLNKQELNTLSELYEIDIKDCEVEVSVRLLLGKMNLS